MNRLTRRTIGNKNYTVKKSKEEWLENIIQNSVNKLGKLEDLMEEYNLESIEDLENLLALQTIKVGGRSNGKSIIAKGILYNQLSDELGCPLGVVFRAMKCGIEFEHKITNEKLISKSIRVFYFQNKWKIRAYIERYNTKDAFDRDLKDYQKTWWLKGEKQNAN